MAIKMEQKPEVSPSEKALSQAEIKAGKAAANSLHRQTRKEEREVEMKTGEDLLKGEERFDERSKSSDGKSAGEKQV